jgi:type II secretory ATPase GspE/PulE/Tfp pilus assembly ATPase PilB-like protein
MVGEVRDPITAETVVRAANSGHLVFATLHAPVAAGAIDSMLALGVAPHFLAASLSGIVSQRLVRTLCSHCRVALDVTGAPNTFRSVEPWLPSGQGATLFGAAGCEHCRQEGYSGRTGVFEVMRMTNAIRRMILDNRSAKEIHAAAVEQGMLDLRQAALLKVAAGTTSTEELARAIPSDQLLPGD